MTCSEIAKEKDVSGFYHVKKLFPERNQLLNFKIIRNNEKYISLVKDFNQVVQRRNLEKFTTMK